MNGAIIWEGQSSYDGHPIAVIMTGLKTKSTNSKTGDMVQTYILRTDINPVEALKTGDDESICGDCKHRPLLAKDTGEARCYVNVGQGAAMVYKTYKNGRYPKVTLEKAAELVRGRNVRFGTYGDPCVAPIEVFKALASTCNRRTGYTHRWRDADFNMEWAELVMASVDNMWEQVTATALGMRYFRVQIGDDKPIAGEISCPASKEAGYKTTCTNCCLCSGTTIKAKNILIIDHAIGHQSRAKKLKEKQYETA